MIFKEDNMLKRQFTATVYIIDKQSVLLIHHKKLNKWLPPGGHMDPNEIPPEAAIREAYEETGLHIELLEQENIHINQKNAKSVARPWMCLLEEIPKIGAEEAHQHIDFIYVGKPTRGEVTHNVDETHGIRWFTIEDLEKLKPEVDIFQETLETIRKLLSEVYCG
jgi:8-oxo-dGTP pyrophosphatase MutT (NUDIX family)